jgi:hypothetical protein
VIGSFSKTYTRVSFCELREQEIRFVSKTLLLGVKGTPSSQNRLLSIILGSESHSQRIRKTQKTIHITLTSEFLRFPIYIIRRLRLPDLPAKNELNYCCSLFCIVVIPSMTLWKMALDSHLPLLIDMLVGSHRSLETFPRRPCTQTLYFAITNFISGGTIADPLLGVL